MTLKCKKIESFLNNKQWTFSSFNTKHFKPVLYVEVSSRRRDVEHNSNSTSNTAHKCQSSNKIGGFMISGEVVKLSNYSPFTSEVAAPIPAAHPTM